MNLREGDVVSAVALVVESDAPTAAPAAGIDEPPVDGMDLVEDFDAELEPDEDVAEDVEPDEEEGEDES
jgi:hypothetical protein